MKVLLVDDHPIVCEALSGVLASLEANVHCHHVCKVGEALEYLANAQSVDLILYDWHLPDGGGIQGLIAISQMQAQRPVVVISANESPDIIHTALQAGARGYIPKSLPVPVMKSALRLILQGETYIPSASLQGGPSQAAPEVIGETALTRRQRDVLCLLNEGHSNKQIARCLKIAEVTVRSHASSLFKRLRVKNRTEAVVKARRLGLLSFPRDLD